MPLPEDDPAGDATPEDDSAAIDRAFIELVAGYHLTADRPDPVIPAADQAILQPAASVEPVSAPELETEHFVSPPMEPLPRPGLPAVLGWIGICYASVFVLLTAAGIRLPAIAGWLAIAGFLGAFVILIMRLPKSRPPGDGARL